MKRNLTRELGNAYALSFFFLITLIAQPVMAQESSTPQSNMLSAPNSVDSSTSSKVPTEGLIPRKPADKKQKMLTVTDTSQVSRVVIKFHEGSGIRLRSGRLTPLISVRELIVDGLRISDALLGEELRLIESRARDLSLNIAPLFTVDEAKLLDMKTRGEQLSGRQLADLNLFFQALIPSGLSIGQLETFVADLNALSSIEIAYLEPVPWLTQVLNCSTSDCTNFQNYLGPAPNGIASQSTWTIPGGRGAQVRVVDVEAAWNAAHEDLPPLFYTAGPQSADIRDRNHGTAVLGIIAGRNDNNIGITGIASDAEIGYSSILSPIPLGVIPVPTNTSNAIAIALNDGQVRAGDIILIEQQRRYNANNSPDDCCACEPSSPPDCVSQCDMIPVEFWQADFEVISHATSLGVIVIEAAGNGATDLDETAVYGDAFNRNVRNSGAILVSAGSSTARQPECFTNWSNRVDVHAWGDSVFTLGYCDPAHRPPLSSIDWCASNADGTENSWYTFFFGGTSSASAIVTSAAASLQGIAINNLGLRLTPELMRQVLVNTGTPQVVPISKNIGPQPDLGKASDELLHSIKSSPASNNFGNVNLTSSSALQTFTISNAGAFNLIPIWHITITGADSSDFVLQTDNCSASFLSLSQTCTVQVYFAPTSVGSKNASLNIPYTVFTTLPMQTLPISLNGTGVATLTVSKTGTGDGTVTSSDARINCGTNCSAQYALITTVTLIAAPAAGSSFAGWSGGGCSGTSSCTVTTDASKSVTAIFSRPVLSLIKTGEGTGTVTSTPSGINCGSSCSIAYNLGTSVTLTAAPSPGSFFTGWSGGGCSGLGSCTVTMNSDTTVGAIFQSCSNSPARIGNVFYPSIQAAYGAASDGAIIQSQNVTLINDFIANRAIAVTLDGGYRCDYQIKTGTTNLKGMITTSSGVTTIKDFVLIQ